MAAATVGCVCSAAAFGDSTALCASFVADLAAWLAASAAAFDASLAATLAAWLACAAAAAAAGAGSAAGVGLSGAFCMSLVAGGVTFEVSPDGCSCLLHPLAKRRAAPAVSPRIECVIVMCLFISFTPWLVYSLYSFPWVRSNGRELGQPLRRSPLPP